ncbi:MAG: hypothetical protein GXO15_00095 [Crenarchaeota archaeon]|nr:hypothetical protein [Thermoproteota archaeon]
MRVEEALLEALCRRGPLGFQELYREARKLLPSLSREEARLALAELVRKGLVARVERHEERRLVFRAEPPACRGETTA